MIQNLGELLSDKSITEVEFVLNGLIKGHVGMLIASPSIGKSHLALSIAMEHASSLNLLGLSCAKIPSKVLVISAEDGSSIIRERMREKMESLPDSVCTQLMDNLMFLADKEPLIVPDVATIEERSDIKGRTDKIVNFVNKSGIDLIIIDTVSEAIGVCDEVKDDKRIKAGFQSLAKRTNASVLLVHHINKGEIRGDQEITMASGAGLSSIMRLVKFLITLTRDKNDLVVKFLKSNYLPHGMDSQFPVVFDMSIVKRVGLSGINGLCVEKPVVENIVAKIIPACVTKEPKVIKVIPDNKPKKPSRTRDVL